MKLRHLLLVPLLAIGTTGCLNSSGQGSSIAASNDLGGDGTAIDSSQVSRFDTNLYPINKVVCDPFDPTPPSLNDGLVATLFYRGQGQAEFSNVADYLNQAQRSTQHLFFSNLDVPTRMFSLGFPTETGGMVQNDVGDDLIEYFALKFSSVLKLNDSDDEGTYEFVLLSDDGALFKVQQADGSYKTLVDNDGTHPTRLGCGTQTLTMTKSSEMLVELDYYQGPRYHISLVPMWRKVSSSNPAETLCGREGNTLFFDPDHGSVALDPYNQLLARGWKPIQASNWHLPATSVFNPCTPGTVPVISDFKLASSEEGFVTLTWSTNIPATSQIYHKNIATGEEGLTASDNVLRTEHSVHLYQDQNMVIGQTYDFQAISISADYGKALSDLLRITVQ